VKESLADLKSRSGAEDIIVLFSGGRDSTVLLEIVSHLKADLGIAVRAVHIDHGLTKESQNNSRQCELFARLRKIPIVVHRLAESPSPGDSVEEWARRQRYGYISQIIGSRTLALTAHHLNDQVETIIQRFVAGSGPHGLRGIMPIKRLGPGYLGRPLLTVQRKEITAFAKSRNLVWFDDPMNEILRYERNRIRKKVVPQLESVSKGLTARLVKLSQIQAEVAEILDSIADSKLLAEKDFRSGLSVELLKQSDLLIRPFVLKRALLKAGVPVPREKKIKVILEQMLEARIDSRPLVKIGNYDLRRYDGRIYIMKSFEKKNIEKKVYEWDGLGQLKLPWGGLSATRSRGPGISEEFIRGKGLIIKFRQGGERFQPSDRNKSTELKKLFQEWRIPPWERPLIPLIHIGDELVAVGSKAIGKSFQTEGRELETINFTWDLFIYNTEGTDWDRVA